VSRQLNSIRIIKEKKDWYYKQLKTYKKAFNLGVEYGVSNKVFKELKNRIKESEKYYKDFFDAYKILKKNKAK
jgi:hypothetical protein